MIKIFKISVLTTIILVIGLILDMGDIRVPQGIDKIYHVILFFLATSIFLLYYMKLFGKKWLPYLLVFILFFSGIIADITEKLQQFSNIRTCEFGDWLANNLGMLLAVVFIYLLSIKSSGEKEN